MRRRLLLITKLLSLLFITVIVEAGEETPFICRGAPIWFVITTPDTIWGINNTFILTKVDTLVCAKLTYRNLPWMIYAGYNPFDSDYYFANVM